VAGRRASRVVQWATGSLGQIAIRACAARDDLELVGCFVTSPEKDGRDAGELAGIAPLGIRATTDGDAVLAIDADCVFYAPLRPSTDDVCRILAAGRNVVTASAWLAPARTPADERARIERACASGGTSLYCTGVHPGYLAETTVWNLARLSQRIDRIAFHETADLSPHPSPAILDMLGFGRAPGDQTPRDDAAMDVDGFLGDSMHLLADGLGVAIDDVTADFEVAVTTEDVTVAAGTIAAGTVGAKRFRWTGTVAGVERIEYTTTYWVTDRLEAGWVAEPAKYTIVIEGEPSLRCALDALHGEGGAIGRVWAAMAAVNAIPEVCAATPGMRTHLDLPMHVPAGIASGWLSPP
jgi:hypothetical protein